MLMSHNTIIDFDNAEKVEENEIKVWEKLRVSVWERDSECLL